MGSQKHRPHSHAQGDKSMLVLEFGMEASTPHYSPNSVHLAVFLTCKLWLVSHFWIQGLEPCPLSQGCNKAGDVHKMGENSGT